MFDSDEIDIASMLSNGDIPDNVKGLLASVDLLSIANVAVKLVGLGNARLISDYLDVLQIFQYAQSKAYSEFPVIMHRAISNLADCLVSVKFLKRFKIIRKRVAREFAEVLHVTHVSPVFVAMYTYDDEQYDAFMENVVVRHLLRDCNNAYDSESFHAQYDTDLMAASPAFLVKMVQRFPQFFDEQMVEYIEHEWLSIEEDVPDAHSDNEEDLRNESSDKLRNFDMRLDDEPSDDFSDEDFGIVKDSRNANSSEVKQTATFNNDGNEQRIDELLMMLDSNPFEPIVLSREEGLLADERFCISEDFKNEDPSPLNATFQQPVAPQFATSLVFCRLDDWMLPITTDNIALFIFRALLNFEINNHSFSRHIGAKRQKFYELSEAESSASESPDAPSNADELLAKSIYNMGAELYVENYCELESVNRIDRFLARCCELRAAVLNEITMRVAACFDETHAMLRNVHAHINEECSNRLPHVNIHSSSDVDDFLFEFIRTKHEQQVLEAGMCFLKKNFDVLKCMHTELGIIEEALLNGAGVHVRQLLLIFTSDEVIKMMHNSIAIMFHQYDDVLGAACLPQAENENEQQPDESDDCEDPQPYEIFQDDEQNVIRMKRRVQVALSDFGEFMPESLFNAHVEDIEEWKSDCITSMNRLQIAADMVVERECQMQAAYEEWESHTESFDSGNNATCTDYIGNIIAAFTSDERAYDDRGHPAEFVMELVPHDAFCMPLSEDSDNDECGPLPE